MTEEDLLARAVEERRSIVEKYKSGRQNGANIDPWEDATLEVYGYLDRYGFRREKNDIYAETKQEIQREREREQKWLKMLKQWENVDTEKLKRRIYKGIPIAIRGRVWSKILGLDKTREEQRGKYKEMCDLAWKYSPDIRQIDLDVNRTYREHIMFRERYCSKQCELFNVLGAYSVYNLEIGYCQGMSQIVALLLMYLDEEDAFWALSTLVSDSKFNMHGFYIPGFPKLLRYQEHHDKIMNKFLPKLKKHLDRNGVDTGIYTLKWFFQCFLDRIPFKLTLRVWDIFIWEGEKVLTAMAFNILKLHRKQIQRLGMDDILQYLQVKLPKNFDLSDDIVIENLQKCMEDLRKSKLDYAGLPPTNELPKEPFGLFKPDKTFEQKTVGRRREFTSVEKLTRDNVLSRKEEALANCSPNEQDNNRHSDLSAAEASFDDGSSLLGEGSHKSLAGTSITSTADLSIFSTATRSQAVDAGSLNAAEVESDDDDRNSSGLATPLAVPKHSPSPDVVRIFVPYVNTSRSSVQSSPQNGDLFNQENRIRIKIEEQSSLEDIQTPIIEQNSIFNIESSVVDLK
ncbi:USP6 N-terminal-like protein [Planococcus citri]|uniref:USP6 N-terminal-like protein n=1 Tax=Planococcus citri TaxID=170843 RepID=UPI0031F7DB73